MDNIFAERQWRKQKYEYIYLNRPENGVDLFNGLTGYFEHCSSTGYHQALNYEMAEKIHYTGVGELIQLMRYNK